MNNCSTIIADDFACLFHLTTVSRFTIQMLTPFSIFLDGWRLSINVCGEVHRDTICGFLVSWLQTASEPFGVFSYSVFDYICFTVMFQGRRTGRLCGLNMHVI